MPENPGKSKERGSTPAREILPNGSAGHGELDPFDPSSYRKPDDDRLADVQSNGLPSAIHVGRPRMDWIFRIDPRPKYRCMLRVYQDRLKSKSGADYLWSPNLPIPKDLEPLVKEVLVAAAITSEGVSFVYSVATGSSWYESASRIMKESMTAWKRQKADSTAGEYVELPVHADPGEPKFPDCPFREYLDKAFRKHLITSLDDEIVHRMRGVR